MIIIIKIIITMFITSIVMLFYKKESKAHYNVINKTGLKIYRRIKKLELKITIFIEIKTKFQNLKSNYSKTWIFKNYNI